MVAGEQIIFSSLFLICQVWRSHLVGEQRPDVAEELQLLLQRVSALLRRIHDVQHRRPQVSQSRDGLHLDGVPLLQRVVQDAGCVHHLQPNTKHSAPLQEQRSAAICSSRVVPASGGICSPCDPRTETWWWTRTAAHRHLLWWPEGKGHFTRRQNSCVSSLFLTINGLFNPLLW